jgi:hypothetical protein
MEEESMEEESMEEESMEELCPFSFFSVFSMLSVVNLLL